MSLSIVFKCWLSFALLYQTHIFYRKKLDFYFIFKRYSTLWTWTSGLYVHHTFLRGQKTKQIDSHFTMQHFAAFQPAMLFSKACFSDSLTYDWDNGNPDADAARLAELAQDYTALVACPAPSRENILDGNASHTNINALRLAIRSWLAHYSLCVCNDRGAKSTQTANVFACAVMSHYSLKSKTISNWNRCCIQCIERLFLELGILVRFLVASFQHRWQ